MVGGREKGLEICLYGLALLSLSFGHLRDAVVPTPYSPGERSPSALRVVTWNVGAGLESGGLQEEHLEHVAQRLRTLDPDLAFLQEVRSRSQAERLRSRLGADWFFESAPGALVLCQRGWLASFELERVFRMRAIGVIYHSRGREPVAAVGVHAQAFSAERRNEAIGLATTVLAARPEARRILAGDLNLDLDLDKRLDLFTDDEHLDVETYNFVGLHLNDAARGRGPTAEPDRRLDYIFASKDWSVLSAGPWKGQRAPGMDHDPVVADLGD